MSFIDKKYCCIIFFFFFEDIHSVVIPNFVEQFCSIAFDEYIKLLPIEVSKLKKNDTNNKYVKLLFNFNNNNIFHILEINLFEHSNYHKINLSLQMTIHIHHFF